MKTIGQNDFLEKFKLKFFILKRDGVAIDRMYPIDEDKNYDLIKSVLHENLYWKKFKSKILHLVLLNEYLIAEKRKEFLKIFFEFCLFFPKDNEVFKFLLKYLKIKDSTHLALAMLSYGEMKEKEFSCDEDLQEGMQYLKDKSFQASKEEEEGEGEGEGDDGARKIDGSISNFDFATDLFRTDHYKDDPKKKIENDLKFFKKIKEKDGGVSEESWPSKHSVKRKDKIQRELLNSLQKYRFPKVGKREQTPTQKIELAIKKSIEMLDPKTMFDFFSDIIIALNSMGLHETSLIVTEFIDREWRKYLDEKEVSDRLNLNYLKVITLMDLNKYRDAIFALDKIMATFPLLKREKVCFMYLKAESLKENGHFKLALEIYKWIRKVISSYRRTKQRIKEIESNQ